VKTPVLSSAVSYEVLQDAIRGLREDGISTHGRVTVHNNVGRLLADTFYNPVDLLLLRGTVRSDRLAESRRSGSAEFEVLTDNGFEYTDPLNNYEFVSYIGIETDDLIIWIPLAHLFCNDMSHVSGIGRQVVQCGLVDGSVRYRENPWDKTFAIENEPTYGDAVKLVVADRAFNWTPVVLGTLGTTTVPKTMTFSSGEDPWAVVWKLGQSAGGEVYHDRDGLVRMGLVKTPSQVAPALEIFTDDYAVVDRDLNRRVNRNEVYNGVICRGSAPWLLFPISGEKWDEDPMSPTYRYGKFGERPKIIEDPMVTSNAQCVTAATAEFNRVCGVRQNVEFTALKDPLLEVGSFIRIAQGGKLEGLYVLDTLEIDLTNATMNAGIRKTL
jgi:hypothetical protein